MRQAVIQLVLALLLPGAALAQRGRAETAEGNRLYKEGQYDQAHQKYLEALRRAPESDIIRFNDGNALYQTKEFQRALDAYKSAMESGDTAFQARAWYNMGNTLYRQQQLDGAVDAYKQALRLAPDDVDAKYNLERALQVQKQQKQQQQQQGKGQEKQEGQKNQQQQQQQQQQEKEQQGQEQQKNQPQEQQQQQEKGQEGQEGRMSKEEAERLLRAVQEDPGKIQRPRQGTAAKRRPAKDW